MQSHIYEVGGISFIGFDTPNYLLASMGFYPSFTFGFFSSLKESGYYITVPSSGADAILCRFDLDAKSVIFQGIMDKKWKSKTWFHKNYPRMGSPKYSIETSKGIGFYIYKVPDNVAIAEMI